MKRALALLLLCSALAYATDTTTTNKVGSMPGPAWCGIEEESDPIATHRDVAETITADWRFENYDTFAAESLTNGAMTAGTSWSASNQFMLAGNTAVYTWLNGSGIGQLSQGLGSMAITLHPGRRYKFSYTFTWTGSISSNTTLRLTTATASVNTDLPRTSSTVYFTAAAAPTAFVIYAADDPWMVASFTLDNLYLTEYYGGDLFVGGNVSAYSLNLSVPLAATSVDDAIVETDNAWITGGWTFDPSDGGSPFSVFSNMKISNLNADFLDDHHDEYFVHHSSDYTIDHVHRDETEMKQDCQTSEGYTDCTSTSIFYQYASTRPSDTLWNSYSPNAALTNGLLATWRLTNSGSLSPAVQTYRWRMTEACHTAGCGYTERAEYDVLSMTLPNSTGKALLTLNGDYYTADNIGVGTTTYGTNADMVIGIANGTPPSTSPANMVQLYAEDVAASSELRVRDEAGNVTTLSPHNFDTYDPPADQVIPWSFYSWNPYVGKEVGVDMYKLVKAVEQLSGQQLMYVRDLPPEAVGDWYAEQELVRLERVARIAEQRDRKAIMDARVAEWEALPAWQKKHSLKPKAFDEPILTHYAPKEPPGWLKARLKKK